MKEMGRLLIIDDEPAVGRLIESVARGCGYEVACTADAPAFMDRLNGFDPDAIILDLSMPDMDGIELLRFLAAARCRAKILVISGFDTRVLETAAKLGSAMGLSITGTLCKPVRVADLRAAILAFEQGPVA